ncbi:hypothetical protein MASSI9I_50443 [Massilia sp. 9I]|nr:hypothetical protein MASSI9I_50443 [Massilia sp. 9I]
MHRQAVNIAVSNSRVGYIAAVMIVRHRRDAGLGPNSNHPNDAQVEPSPLKHCFVLGHRHQRPDHV